MTDVLPAVVGDILVGAEALDPRRRERGISEGRWTSTPMSRRAPVNLDVLVLTDRRTGVLAVLVHWSSRIRHAQRLPHPSAKSIRSEAAVLGVYWRWALEQPWGPDMLIELTALSGTIHEVRFGVPVRPCPACREPVRLDRFVTEHRRCIMVDMSQPEKPESGGTAPSPEPQPDRDREKKQLRKQNKTTGPMRPEA